MIRPSDVEADINNLPDFIDQYAAELVEAKKSVNIHGNLEKNLTALPGITEKYFSYLQEIEAVLRYLELQLRKLKRKHFQKYLEAYQRALTSRDAEKYCEGEPEVVEYEVLINEVALLRNKYLGIIKSLESKNFMLGHIVKLRTAGMEDVVI
jgi:hypothetical protein